MKKFLSVLTATICFIACALGLIACNSGDDTGVKLNKTQITLEIGDSETLTATVTPENAVVTWSSDKPAVATVEDGKVTAVTQGTAVITAAAEGKSATCTVTVIEKILPVDPTPVDPTPVDPVAVASVTLNKNQLTLDINGSETLSATVQPTTATDKTVSWTVAPAGVVTVDNGKVTAIAEGTAVVTAMAGGKSDTCTVTVNKATQNPSENPPEVTGNKYAAIVTALEEEIGKSYTNAKVLIIYEYNGFLACVVTTESDALYSIRAKVSTSGHSLTADTVDTKYYTDNIPGARLTQLGYFAKGAYFYGGTNDEKQMVESMITKLLGDGYTIMWGAVSRAREGTIDPTLGNNASFDVCALLEKDGRVFEYSESLTVTKDLGDVYQAFLNSTEANKDYIYKSNHNEPTDLGEVAALYWTECNK